MTTEPLDTGKVRLPPDYLQRGLAGGARSLLRCQFDLEVRGRELFPATGPVVVVANHLGWLDGPLMTVFSPRPLHALTKKEQFDGKTGPLLRAAGQIPLDRGTVDPSAIKTAVAVLRRGGVVGVFPEGNRGLGDVERTRPGAAYLALATGATIQPMIFLGTRDEGASLDSIPSRRSRIAITYGQPIPVQAASWPRRRSDVRRLAGEIQQHLRDLLQDARTTTGLGLPGPAQEAS